MDKMIKVSPGIARLIKPFVKRQNNAGNARTQLLPANIANIRIGGHTILDFIRFAKKMANQGKSSPLSLRSADNANYSDVQALKDRIAKLTDENNRYVAEKQYLKGQYDQQKAQDKALYDNLLTQHGNLQIQYGNLLNQNNNLQLQANVLNNNINTLTTYRNAAINLKNALLAWINPAQNPGNFIGVNLTQAALNSLRAGVQNML